MVHVCDLGDVHDFLALFWCMWLLPEMFVRFYQGLHGFTLQVCVVYLMLVVLCGMCVFVVLPDVWWFYLGGGCVPVV